MFPCVSVVKTRSSKLCKYLILNFEPFLEEFYLTETFCGKVVELLVKSIWWKIFSKNVLVENIW